MFRYNHLIFSDKGLTKIYQFRRALVELSHSPPPLSLLLKKSITRWLMTACRVMKSATESRYPTITWRAESKRIQRIDLRVSGHSNNTTKCGLNFYWFFKLSLKGILMILEVKKSHVCFEWRSQIEQLKILKTMS